ncbi:MULTISPECIES: hypothetical protein [Bacillaceae]|uniref:DUF2564 family protein n=1 Tax=Metabacillus sediminis TaxID=3117746 RepID=A0ABZ2NHV7_9BACI|nr:hypothetical protein [Bacillus sp. SJS]KZZ84147.1 hypothetical protein AS29_013225 [Bacillus sp. SJS]
MIDDALHALHHAEKAVVDAQGNPGSGEFQRAFQKLQLAKEQIKKHQNDELDPEERHHLDLAAEQAIHLHETLESLEDQGPL